MTGIATVVYENRDQALPKHKALEQQQRIDYQMAGAENLAGSHPFTYAASVKAYRLNKFLHGMIDPEHRRRFLETPEQAFAAAGLTPAEQDLLPRAGWGGMNRPGGIFFSLAKPGAGGGVPH